MTAVECIKKVQSGSLGLIACCLFYLIWWSVAFNPIKSFPYWPKVVLFILTAAAGVMGLVFIAKGMIPMPKNIPGISNAVILIFGVAVYAALLFVTSHFLHRQVTTELFLIIGWMILELCIINSIHKSGAMSVVPVAILATVIVIAAVIAMICYLQYYHLEKLRGFYVGMVPLALFAIVMIAVVITVKKCEAGL